MRKFTARLLIVVTLLMIVAALPAHAHEHREVDGYTLAFGWRAEPALAGMMNGPEVFISEAGAAEDAVFPEDTVVDLQAEITFGDQTTTVEFRQEWQSPGHYIAELVPTLPGDYTFRLTGTIGESTIDEVFTSADGEFSTVEPSSDVMFPVMGSTDARIEALEARIAELEAQLAALARDS
jgi:hypothetical protein